MDKEEEITSRLKKIFDIFLNENFATMNNVYFEKLITHLQAPENEFVVRLPMVVDWVDRCITLITEDFNKVHPKVISFMLNFCSYLASNEWVLITLKQREIMNRAMGFMQREEQHFNPSIKLGCIRFLATVNGYVMGLTYIRQMRAWTLLIQYSKNDHTLYVVREARNLLYQLLYKFSAKMKDDAIVLEILGEILKPIHENLYNTDEERIMVNVDDNEVLHKISSTLDLLSYIFQQTLESEERTNIAHLLKVHHNIEITIWKLIEMTQNRYFAAKILTALTSFNFANLVYDKLSIANTTTDNAAAFNEFGLSFFNMMKLCVQRNDGMSFIKLAELNHVLWKKLGTRAPKEILIEEQRVVFENQLICFHMMPLFFSMKSNDDLRGEIFDNYIMKLLEISCHQTLRICYGLRDAFVTTDGAISPNYIAELAHKCIHSILSIERVLEREQAVLVCQALLYVLKEVVMLSAITGQSGEAEPMQCEDSVGLPDHIRYTKMFPAGSEAALRDPKLLHSVMVGLQKVIERFKITWKESVETIGLVNCVAFVLDNRSLDSRCTVQALKLVQLAVEHFMSPNMALLVDNLEGSGLLCLGPIIAKRLHDNAWEVRDTALELTTSIACISRVKFPAFQRFLVDFKIPPIVYQMVKHDCEPFVRASAFKCLSKMVSINLIWENDLSQLDLVDHLLYVLYKENEDIVRLEAITVLTIIYEKRKIPPKYKNTLFSTISYCIVGDHHWEVKMNALHFWKTEFSRQLSNQGMIDGIFPTVTFSKEHKKIVNLTRSEIKLRIAKVIAEMQQYGYYGILLKCLREEYSVEVKKHIILGVKMMCGKLQDYDMEALLKEANAMTPPENIRSAASLFTANTMPSPPSDDPNVNVERANEVIEGILQAQDIHLLERTFESQMAINSASTPLTPGDRHIDEFYYKQFAITVSEFLETMQKYDLEKLVDEQQEWVEGKESFVSLLDDILYAIKGDDAKIVSDCY